ncbi:MAG: super-infection exclusion protein B [Candidatus Omnitrophica bacterium]|nr:super-infection exclusion protein B [Candidatus Omnitrophota bacterium]
MVNFKDYFDKLIELIKGSFSLRVVVFCTCVFILFAPESILLKLGLSSEFLPNEWRMFIGLVTIVSGVSLIVLPIISLIKKVALHVQIFFMGRRVAQMIAGFSYQEKLLLYQAVMLNMPTVFCAINNPIAQTLVSKGILVHAIQIADPMRYPFRIPDHTWKVAMKYKNLIFRDFLNMEPNAVMAELQKIVVL